MSRDQRPHAQWPKPKGSVNAPESVLVYLVEVQPGGYMPTVDASEATHIHAYDAERDGIQVVPIGSDAAGVIMRRFGAESYRIHRV